MSQLRRKLSNCCCCRKPWLLKTLSGTWKETRRRLIVLTCMLEEFWRILCRKHAVLFRFSRVLHLLATRFPAYHTEWLHFSLRFALIGYTFSRASHWLVTRFPALHTYWLLVTCLFMFCIDWLPVFPRLTLTGYLSSRALHLVTCFCTVWFYFFFAFFNYSMVS